MDRKKGEAAPEEAVPDVDKEREALAEDESVQSYKAEHDPAASHTAFGDDHVTPRLNDGR